MSDHFSSSDKGSEPGGGTVMWIGIAIVVAIFVGAILFLGQESSQSGRDVLIKVPTPPATGLSSGISRDAPTELMRGQYYGATEETRF